MGWVLLSYRKVSMLKAWRLVVGFRTIFSQSTCSHPIYNHVCGCHNILVYYIAENEGS